MHLWYRRTVSLLVQCPPFAVSALDGRLQPDPVPETAYSPTDLNVLDLGFVVGPFVKTVRFLKDVPTNGADPGPERQRVPGVLMMHVAVHEVPILGNPALRVRGIVVGAEDRREVLIDGHVVGDQAQSVGVDGDVGIDKNQDVAT